MDPGIIASPVAHKGISSYRPTSGKPVQGMIIIPIRIGTFRRPYNIFNFPTGIRSVNGDRSGSAGCSPVTFCLFCLEENFGIHPVSPVNQPDPGGDIGSVSVKV